MNDFVLAIILVMIDLVRLNRLQKELEAPKIRFKTAVHEAGHALMVLRSNQVQGTVNCASVVPEGDSGTQIRSTLRHCATASERWVPCA